jgi:Group II intron, maturase-specific domain/Reverse transcriptase (RNA-dependent DNA polymerase)
VALSVLDEHFARAPGGPQSTAKQRWTRRQKGLPNCRVIRYADDFVILVSGTRAHAEALLPEVAEILSAVCLRLSEEKTLITHIDEGLDFLGWRIRRHRKRGTSRHYVYNYPAKKAIRSIEAKTKAICRMNVSLPLAVLLHWLNAVLRGWTTYFRPGVPARAFQYLRMIVWRQVFGWLRRKHHNTGWKKLRRRYCDGGWWPRDEKTLIAGEQADRIGALGPAPGADGRQDQDLETQAHHLCPGGGSGWRPSCSPTASSARPGAGGAARARHVYRNSSNLLLVRPPGFGERRSPDAPADDPPRRRAQQGPAPPGHEGMPAGSPPPAMPAGAWAVLIWLRKFY